MNRIEAAAKKIYTSTADQPWEASTVDEESRAMEIATSVLSAALTLTDEAVEAAANAISEASGMRYDGFWTRIEDLEPEDREYAMAEARAALEAALPHLGGGV